MLKKSLISILFIASLAAAQVTYTAPIPPQAATPAKLVVTGGVAPNVVSCTITGNAVPATALTYACFLGSVAITPYTVPFTLGSAYTLQHNYMGHAITIIANALVLPINVTATVDASTPVGGIF